MAEQPVVRNKAWQYFIRGVRLRCPECGISPLFMSVRRTESLTDWFANLSGCPRCGYDYNREPGYFLFALWMVTFTFTGFGGLALLLLFDAWFDLSTPALMVCTIFPIVLGNILMIRHIKAFYLAIDHYVHPYDADEDPKIHGSWGDFH